MQEFSLYERLGKENLEILVDRFYDLVFDDPVISGLFKSDKEEIKRKQFLFLTQFLGGPPIYSEEHGHPRLRARHLPHEITEEKAAAWLKCMHKAIGSLEIPEEMKKELFNRFPQTAFFMVNSK
jgi:hemoglobin